MNIKLSTKQINTLLRGNRLVLESFNNKFYSFTIIGSYQDEKGVLFEKYLNGNFKVFFWIKSYNIHENYINNCWDVHEEDLLDYESIMNIVKIEDIEKILLEKTDDLSLLKLEWQSNSPFP